MGTEGGSTVPLYKAPVLKQKGTVTLYGGTERSTRLPFPPKRLPVIPFVPDGRIDGGINGGIDGGIEGRIDGRDPGYVFPLLLLRRYAGKWDYA